MKTHPIRRFLSAVLSLVVVLAMIPAITPTVFANMHYDGHDTNGDTVTLRYSCKTCGADTDTLTVAVPRDACHREYSYFCVISDGGGTVLSTSDSARLYCNVY